MIVGQNALLNQYVPTFFIKDLRDGQGVIYDSVRKAFVNADIGGGSGGVDRLGELLDVSDNVDNPLLLQNGQALVYNSFTSLWENTFVDYNTLLNKPTLTNGTVTSVDVSGGTTGLTTTGGPVTAAGTITLSGILNVANGGTGASTATGARTNLDVPSTSGSGATGTWNISITGNATTSTTAGNVTGVVAIANGGTGATTASGAINALLPSQTGNTGKFLTTDGTNVSWTTIPLTGGTVTSVSATGTQGVTTSVTNPTTTPQITIGLGDITPTSVAATGTVTGSNITATGTITGSNLSGTNTGDQTITLTGDVTGSGTGTFATTLSDTGVVANTYGSATQVPVFTVDSKGRITSVTNTTISAGTVTSVGLTSANTAISVTGSPITTSGSFTVTANEFTSTDSGIVPASGGGTVNFLRADGTWAAPAGSGTVTSVDVSGGTTGLTTTGGPITSTGTITLGGTLSISNGGTGATTASGAINALLPTQTGNSGKFLTTDGTDVSWVTIPPGTGTVTSVSATGTQGVTTLVTNASTTPEINIGLGDITPTSVAAVGTVTGSNLSGTNTGDQTITLTGDITGSGTGTFATTLATVNTSPGTYGDDHYVPTITVNDKGLVTSITTQHVDTTVRDLVPETETFVVSARHQYIVTGELEVDGYIINNGVIAIL